MPSSLLSLHLLVVLLLPGATVPTVRPLWSWSTLQPFLHTSDLSGLMDVTTTKVIAANFPMVTIEKWQGVHAKPAGNTDAKIIAQCTALKNLKPSLTCIMYWDTNTVWDCNGTASPSNPAFCGGRDTEMIAYEGAITANRDPDKYLLKQPDGSLYVSGYVNAHVIDFRKPAGTALWIETCTNATATGNVDGCFADFCSWGLPESSYPGFSAAHNAAVNDLSAAMGATGLAIGNNCQHDPKSDNLQNWRSPSAVFMEGFSNDTHDFTTLLSYSNTSLWPRPPLVQVHLGAKECWARVNAKPKPGDSLGYGCNNSLAAILVPILSNKYLSLYTFTAWID